MQHQQLDILVSILVGKRRRVGREVPTVAMSVADDTAWIRWGKLMAVLMRMAGIHLCQCRLSVFMLLSADMPMRVRTRRPGRQQGDGDEQSDSRSCLAETIQHLQQRSRRDGLDRSREVLVFIRSDCPQ